MGHNLSHLLHDTLGTLALSAAALGVALVVTLPGAVWLGHLHRGSSAAIRTANLGRSLPELALIAIFLALFGIGFLNVMLALVIVGIPPILANAYTAVDGVDPDVVDAARGMGMSALAVLLKVEVPLALPLMFAGIRTSVLFIIGASPLGGDRGRRRTGRDHRQPGELRILRRAGGFDLGGGAGAAGPGPVRAPATGDHPGRAQGRCRRR